MDPEGNPYLHDALANKNVHDSNASRTTHPETPFQTQNSSETPQHKRPHSTRHMSLHQLLQECGVDDDDAGSDMDVCIGSDPPAAVPAAVSGGTDSLPAGGTSLTPQEDEAQGPVTKHEGLWMVR